MKKVLLIIALFMISLTLKAVEPTVNIYLKDGNSKEYKIEDITDMSFVKSETPYFMAIYTTNGKITYDINDISSIIISTLTKSLIIEKSDSFQPIQIETIDSINFIPKLSNGIAIGPFTCMGKNLDVVYYRNGDTIPQVTDSLEWVNLKTGAWCYYNNDPAMGAIYGKLYNWYAVNDPRGLAPVGWHIPSFLEWSYLAGHLHNDSLAGGMLKSTGTIEEGDGLWYSPNKGATNEINFSALPGGYRDKSGVFNQLGYQTNWWSSDEYYEDNAFIITLYHNYTVFGMNENSKCAGLSVRCMKDYKIPIIKSLTPNSSQVSKMLIITGTGFGAERKDSYVSFGTLTAEKSDYISWSDTEIKLVIPQEAKSGWVYAWIGGFVSNYVSFVINTIDPDYFEPITIGTQVWMSRNLNVDYYRNGDPIPQVKPSELNNLKTGAYCYYNMKSENEEIYGKLYNWYAVNDPRGLAPEGWHVASDAEWKVLTDYLGDTTVAGGKMKTTGNLSENTGLWKEPNFGATNESGFSALPGGKLPLEMGTISYVNFYGYWWTSTESDSENAWYRKISNTSASCSRFSQNKGMWFSVRCIKD